MEIFTIWIALTAYISVAGLSLFALACVMWVSSFAILFSWRKPMLEEAPQHLNENNHCNRIS